MGKVDAGTLQRNKQLIQYKLCIFVIKHNHSKE